MFHLKQALLSATAFGMLSSVAMAQEVVFFAPHSPKGPEAATDVAKLGVNFEKLRSSQAKGTPGPTFTVAYADVINDTNAGFDDPTLGPARRQVVNEVLLYIGSLLDETGNCDVFFRPSLNVNNGFLGFAGTAYPIVANSFQPGLAFEHITTGVDPVPGTADIEAEINFFFNYNLNPAVPSATNQFDLFSVLLHEITHGLGISSGSNASGGSRIDASGVFTTFDQLMFSNTGNPLWNSGATFSGFPLNQGENFVQFRGSNATATFGAFPPIHTPTTFASGTSMSHWQLNSPIPSSTVMRPSLANGVDNRQYQEFEKQALADLGYDLVIPSNASHWNLY
jgi:hypothetical protein